MSKKLFTTWHFTLLLRVENAFTSVACVRSQSLNTRKRKRTYVLRTMRRWQLGRGMGDENWEGGGGKGGGEGKRWGDRGWRGGGLERGQRLVAWCCFMWHLVSINIRGAMYNWGEGEGGESEDREAGGGRGGRRTSGEEKVGWLMLFNDTWSQ